MNNHLKIKKKNFWEIGIESLNYYLSFYISDEDKIYFD
jgi:hypothetical protein